MKTLVLSTLIAVAAAGNTFANHTAQPVTYHGIATKETAEPTKCIDSFKSQVIFHQQNVAVLWNQYDMAVARIKNNTGNHAALEEEKAYFIGLYKNDIENGVRVTESKAAIAEIETKYEQKHADREVYEATQIAQLQRLLKKELKREIKSFEKAKKRNAELINGETTPLLREVEQYFAQSIERVDSLLESSDTPTVAAK